MRNKTIIFYNTYKSSNTSLYVNFLPSFLTLDNNNFFDTFIVSKHTNDKITFFFLYNFYIINRNKVVGETS